MQPPSNTFTSTFPTFPAEPRVFGLGETTVATTAPSMGHAVHGLATVQPGPLPANVLSQVRGCVDGFGGIVELEELVDAFLGLEQSQLEAHFDIFHDGSQ